MSNADSWQEKFNTAKTATNKNVKDDSILTGSSTGFEHRKKSNTLGQTGDSKRGASGVVILGCSKSVVDNEHSNH